MNRQSMNRGAAEVEELQYGEWEMGVASQVKREVAWKFYGYRKALFLYDLC